MRKVLGVLIILVSATLGPMVWAGESSDLSLRALIHWKKGQTTTVQELLQSGRILIFAEKDCGICRSYAKALKACSPDLKNKIEYISMNTPAQTRWVAAYLAPQSNIYVFKDLVRATQDVPATPMTLFMQKDQVLHQIGTLGCESLEKIAKGIKG